VAPISRPAVSARAAPAPPHDGASSVALARQPAAGEIDSAAGVQIAAANIFARSRVAPARHVTVGTGTEVPHVVHAASAPSVTLYGTTTGPEGAVALIDAGSLPRRAEVYRIGDTIAGARLVDISDSTATLERASGVRVLHLPPTARRAP
jgi:hypothetical protein